jgi:hypothetical protein
MQYLTGRIFEADRHMKSFKLLLFTFYFLLFTLSSAFSQDDSTNLKLPDSNTVILHKDPRIELLIRKQASINEITSREGRKTDKGFRLMIISTTKRDEAIAAKTKIYTYFPELKAYLWYQSPYFRLKAGNFKDRKDAEAYQKRLNIYFPNGVFIMKDIIEVKPSKGNEDES